MNDIIILLVDRGVKEAFIYQHAGDIQDIDELKRDDVGYMIVRATILDISPQFDLGLD